MGFTALVSFPPTKRAVSEPPTRPDPARPRRARAAPARRPPGQGRSGVLHYVLGALVGAVVFPVLVGLVFMVGLYYAEWLLGFDTKNDRFSELVAGTVLVAPFLGLLVGLGVVAWRRHRARRRRG